MMYCITHESWASPELMDYVPSVCVWTTCPPPALDNDWVDAVSTPSEDELAQINENALLLLADFLEM